MIIKDKKAVSYAAYDPRGENGCYVHTGKKSVSFTANFYNGRGVCQPLEITINGVKISADAIIFAMYVYCGMLYDIRNLRILEDVL